MDVQPRCALGSADRQPGRVLGARQCLSPLLPALSASAQDSVVTYNSFTPRLGVTYALNESRKTIARASYAIFASQLNSTRGTVVSQIPATGVGSGYVYYLSHAT